MIYSAHITATCLKWLISTVRSNLRLMTFIWHPCLFTYLLTVFYLIMWSNNLSTFFPFYLSLPCFHTCRAKIFEFIHLYCCPFLFTLLLALILFWSVNSLIPTFLFSNLSTQSIFQTDIPLISFFFIIPDNFIFIFLVIVHRRSCMWKTIPKRNLCISNLFPSTTWHECFPIVVKLFFPTSTWHKKGKMLTAGKAGACPPNQTTKNELYVNTKSTLLPSLFTQANIHNHYICSHPIQIMHLHIVLFHIVHS